MEEGQGIFDYIREHKKTIILSFLVVAILIFILGLFAGFNKILLALEGVDPSFLVLNFVFEGMILVLWTFRWRLILNLVDESPKFSSLFFMLLASIFGNNITPGAAGGEPLRAYLLFELRGTPFEIGFASSTADRVFEFIPFAIISLLSAILIMTWEVSIWTRFIVSFLIIFTIIVFSVAIYAGTRRDVAQRIVLSIMKSVLPFIRNITRRRFEFGNLKDRIIFYVNRFSSGFSMALTDRRVLVIGFLLSLIMWFLDLTRIYICFQAIGVEPPIAPLIIIYTVGILISLLPLLPGSLGLREGILVALFAVTGISADYVMAASVIDRLASYITPTFFGFIAAVYYGRIIIRNHQRI
ncbi:UPF0104 family protein [Methanothermobacter tenebrarum]|uniref:UPF0104 family protein n=1 Tax=Methanothermobacter tenebrarum TaxID=680118 RepID=A0A328PC88_9EURY|nr:UPF0104 family protein [Methanothermobacter tenebrarum]NPV64942.1 UPF0104 family protein [Methanobacteriaceae archaeon]RAO79370.1 UPF0104 family protein [Methanothermobacter tenebrarum]